ncbi:MAG: formate dehydrogenase subunit alpha [Desulfohalobiaceae bacterium]|nr:formate dehydrogenase subunit alpha [Desulfohalobiaceae bacterium]
MAGLATAFGSGAMTNSIGDIEEADCIFITGSNTTSSHPIIADRVYRAKEKGARVIVADPRRIHIARLADVHVQQKLGTDVALLNGIMHVILEQGWQDQEFIDQRCEGFESLRDTVKQYSPSVVEGITGVPAGDIERVAELYARANAASILYCMGITQHTTGVDNVKSLANLAMLTGNIGRPGTGLNPLRGQNNVQGACDMGGLPNVFSGYQQVSNPEANSKFASAWQAELSDKPGLPIPDMLAGLEDKSVQGLYVLGENPVMSDPDSDHVSHALQQARFVVVQDIFLTETAQMAHVVLPGVSFAEKDGTFTNTERRVMRVRKAVEPVGDSRQDWEIIQDLSNRLGYSMSYSSPEEIMQEIAQLTPSYGGITYQRLEGDGLQWPCPDTGHPGTKILHQERFARGLGLFHGVEHQAPAESVDQEYPYWLTTGRIYTHYHTGTMTHNSPTLEREAPEGWMEIHPDDARKLGVRTGDRVRVASRRGSVEAAAYVTEDISPGTVFMTFHYVESNANVLTNPATDPIARIPEYKVCAVSLEKAA